MALKKSQTLAETHQIKAIAYKVDGACVQCPQLYFGPGANSDTSVSESSQVQDIIAQVVRDFGKIDVFVANAGK